MLWVWGDMHIWFGGTFVLVCAYIFTCIYTQKKVRVLNVLLYFPFLLIRDRFSDWTLSFLCFGKVDWACSAIIPNTSLQHNWYRFMQPCWLSHGSKWSYQWWCHLSLVIVPSKLKLSPNFCRMYFTVIYIALK